jgi:hypothetical protein
MYTIKNEIKGKREGVEVYNYKDKADKYLLEMLQEAGFILEKKTRGYIRLGLEGIGEIIIHSELNNGMNGVNIYLPGLRQLIVKLFSGREKGTVTYIYKYEKIEKEKGTLTIREFTDRVLEEIRQVWINKKG